MCQRVDYFFHRPYHASSRAIIHLWRQSANNERFHGISWWLLYSITNLRHGCHTMGNFRETRLPNEPWILQDIAERDVSPERYCRFIDRKKVYPRERWRRIIRFAWSAIPETMNEMRYLSLLLDHVCIKFKWFEIKFFFWVTKMDSKSNWFRIITRKLDSILMIWHR